MTSNYWISDQSWTERLIWEGFLEPWIWLGWRGRLCPEELQNSIMKPVGRRQPEPLEAGQRQPEPLETTKVEQLSKLLRTTNTDDCWCLLLTWVQLHCDSQDWQYMWTCMHMGSQIDDLDCKCDQCPSQRDLKTSQRLMQLTITRSRIVHVGDN